MGNAAKGCASIFLILAITGLLFFAGCTSMVRSLSEWRQSANLVKMVQIRETQATERTRIEWNARKEVAHIQADATKKTSWAFTGFYLARAVTWAVVGVWLLVVGKVVLLWTSRD